MDIVMIYCGAACFSFGMMCGFIAASVMVCRDITKKRRKAAERRMREAAAVKTVWNIDVPM